MRLRSTAQGGGSNPGEAPAPILSMRFSGLCFFLYLRLSSSLSGCLDSFLCFFSFLNPSPSPHTTTLFLVFFCVSPCAPDCLSVCLYVCVSLPAASFSFSLCLTAVSIPLVSLCVFLSQIFFF